jgi:hypothetical protein
MDDRWDRLIIWGIIELHYKVLNSFYTWPDTFATCKLRQFKLVGYTLLMVEIPLYGKCLSKRTIGRPRRRQEEHIKGGVSRHHGTARPRVADEGDVLQIQMVTVNILSKQLWTAENWWSSSLWGWARRVTTHREIKTSSYEKCCTAPRNWADYLEGSKQWNVGCALTGSS